ncbi:DNA-binding protein [Acidovorax sp. 1608163]|nr:DNA-binding protein [Acidovorax sp. 1608163]
MQPNLVRGPRGVQMEDVWAAADAVLNQGERPTIERVRQQLGRGSPNTVGPMLDGWYGSLAKRLLTPGEALDSAQDPGEQLPGPVLRAAKTLWGRAVQHAQEAATAEMAQAQVELDKRAEDLKQAQQDLDQERQRLQDRSEALAVAMQAKDAQITEAAGQVRELHAQLQACQSQLDEARAQNIQRQQAAEAQRLRHESAEAEHRTERLRLEERAQANERRLNTEVDRVRQESKKLASQLETDNRKSALALAEAAERMSTLEARLATLQGEKAQLAKELQLARDESTIWKAKLDERSNDMFAVLNELRDRLPPSNSETAATAGPGRNRRKR